MDAGKDPTVVLMAGDWHGERRWAVTSVAIAASVLPADGPRIIIQHGDMGIWSLGDPYYLDPLNDALEEHDVDVWFIDGNHENHEALIAARIMSPSLDPYAPVPIRPRIKWLPRGHRWQWHGRTWLACGGAASPDRALRVPGMSWFPQEYITQGQEDAIIAAGPADVLVSHDRPAGAPIYLPPWPSIWDVADLARCEVNRERMGRICAGTRVSYVIHGHYHRRAQAGTFDLGYGPVFISQLDMNGTDGNLGLLDVRDMRWKWLGLDAARDV